MYVAGRLKWYFAVAILVLMAFLLLVSTQFAHTKVIYVDDDAVGANDGTTWANAYVYLQDALADASDSRKPVEIRVAQGVYTPDQGANQTPGDRQAAFQLANRISLRGGFAGLTGADPNARDVNAYETTLSGDLADDDEPARLKEFIACFSGDDVPVKTGGEGFDFDGDNDVDNLDLIAFSQANNRRDNSYHVVTASGTKKTAVLDGFTISGGNTSNPQSGNSSESDGSLGYGGGMYNYHGSPTVANCVFTGNLARCGGGMSNYRSNPRLANCTLRGNSAWHGGGVFNWEKSSPTLTSCTFDRNSGGVGGGIENNMGSSPVLTDCSFTGNSGRAGSGMYNGDHSNPTLVDCAFGRNWAGRGGGAVYNGSHSNPTLIDCAFSDNWAGWGGGGMVNSDRSRATLTKCTFGGNSARICGGAVWSWENSNSTFRNCTFTANSAAHGGAIASASRSSSAPAVLTLTVANCTFSGNWARYGGAIVNGHCSRAELTNCILWGNTADLPGSQVCLERAGSLTVKHCCLQGGRSAIGIRPASRTPIHWGSGNIDVDPLFTDPGCWAGVNDPNRVVKPTDPNAIWVEGDYHLKSQAGRWHVNGRRWVRDDVTSPCIDAGDPKAPVGEEREPNGSRVNMGAYGGTMEASKSP